MEIKYGAVDLAQLLIKSGADVNIPTKDQISIIESLHEGPSLIIAGAGSGKTETMSARVIWLVANGFVTPDQVLGLTFTRKAAGELTVRIRKRLRQLKRAGALPDHTRGRRTHPLRRSGSPRRLEEAAVLLPDQALGARSPIAARAGADRQADHRGSAGR